MERAIRKPQGKRPKEPDPIQAARDERKRQRQKQYEQRRDAGVHTLEFPEPLDVGEGFAIWKLRYTDADAEDALTRVGLLDPNTHQSKEEIEALLRRAFLEGRISLSTTTANNESSGTPEREDLNTLKSDHGHSRAPKLSPRTPRTPDGDSE